MKNLPNNTAVHQDGPFTSGNCPRRPHVPEVIKQKRYLSVKELSKEYKMSLRIIYSLIERDATFPFVNMGFKKKYMIDREAFETWILSEPTKSKANIYRFHLLAN